MHLPTSSSELRRRGHPTAQRNSSSGGGGTINVTCDPPSSPWILHQRDGSAAAPRTRPASSMPLAPSILSVNSLLSAAKRPRFQALLCLVLTVTPWIVQSSQNHKLQSVHDALSKLVKEHRLLLAGLEHSQRELDRAERQANEVELDNKELVDVLASATATATFAAAAATTTTTTRQHTGVDIDSINHVPDEDEDADSGSSSSTTYREAQHLEDLYLERIGMIEAAIQNHSLQHLRDAYLPVLTHANVDDDESAALYVEIRLVSEEEHDTTAGAAEPSHGVLVLETAPLKVAPHAVDYFLRLVESNYYGGRTMAMVHQPTLLPAAMTSASKKTSMQQQQAFTHRIHTVERQPQQHGDIQDRNGATANNKAPSDGRTAASTDGSPSAGSMAFKEHHRGAYPVQKYSVIFHGRAGGGPHFAVHMMDRNGQQQQGSTGSHGEEEGTGDDDDDEEEEDWDHDDADACFGRIVRGQQVLDRLVEASHRTKRQQRIIIDSVTLLPGRPW